MAPPAPRAIPRGRTERGFDEAVAAARAAGRLEDAATRALVGATRDLARAIDRATPGPRDEVTRPYDLVPLAQLAREYRANVEALGLVPPQNATGDAADAWLAGLSAPTRVPDTPQP
jgi:hypothetical protein